jgi:hypothetical protein
MVRRAAEPRKRMRMLDCLALCPQKLLNFGFIWMELGGGVESTTSVAA